jgi:hypothetical protein
VFSVTGVFSCLNFGGKKQIPLLRARSPELGKEQSTERCFFLFHSFFARYQDNVSWGGTASVPVQFGAIEYQTSNFEQFQNIDGVVRDLLF